MIQFNLLPDVKLEYIKVQRVKRTVIGIALIAAGSAFAVFLILFLAVNVVQKENLKDLNADIKKYDQQIQDTPDLSKIVTIQSQLGALPALHAAKPAAERTFTFVQQFTPADVALTQFKTDHVANTYTISGEAPGLDKVNAFIDTLKFTQYETDGELNSAFSGVVLSQFSRNTDMTTFTIVATFDPVIYDNAKTIGLRIPSTVSTRSVVEQPSDIFRSTTNTETNTNTEN